MSVAYRARRLFIMLRTKWPSTSFAIAIFLDIALMIYIAMELSPFYEKPSITREQISEHLDPYQVALVVSYYEKPPSTEVPLILDLDIKVNSLVYSTSQIIFSYEPGVVDVVPSSNPIFSASVAMRDVLSRGDLYEVGASVYHVDLRSLSGFLGIIIIITVSPFLLRLARRGGAERKNGQRLDVDEAASTREILLAEIAFTEESANEIATRSYIALFSGILMSFVGVSTFYITMPSEREVGYGQQSLDALSRLHLANFSRNISESLSASGSDAANNIAPGRGVDDGSRSVPLSPAPLTITEAPVSSVWNSYYFIETVRAFGILLFIEAIAWFLLQQYRSLMAEYRNMYRKRLRRANFLSAYTLSMSSPDGLGRPASAVLASILSEDLSDRLQKGETTEYLVMCKSVEGNPVIDIVRNWTMWNKPDREIAERKEQG